MVARNTIKKLLDISEHLDAVGQGYFHSKPLSSTGTILNLPINYSLFDFGLLAAITESPLLLTGETDRGKTDFAKIVMTSLFGQEEQGWHKTDIDRDFGSMSFSGVNFKEISEGGNSEELFYALPFINFPGLIWDEPNRAPPKLLNKLLHILEKEFTLENGKKVKSGHPDGNHGTYQLHFLAMNEGDQYHGTSSVDRALRRRQSIEIPIDVFPTSMSDKMSMVQKRSGKLDIHNGETNLDDILEIMKEAKELSFSKEAEQMRLYLQSMGSCVRSKTGTKNGIVFSESICTQQEPLSAPQDNGQGEPGCHYLASYPDRMCPNVNELSDGVAIQLGEIAKGYALLRAMKVVETVASKVHLSEGGIVNSLKGAAQNLTQGSFGKAMREYSGEKSLSLPKVAQAFVNQYLERLEVQPEDIAGVLPFIGLNKMRINPHWVEKHHQGSKFHAMQTVASVAYQRVVDFRSSQPDITGKLYSGDSLSDHDRASVEDSYGQDLWLQKSFEGFQNGNQPQNYRERVHQLLSS